MMATAAVAETCGWVVKLYTPDIIVLLWLLYPYRIVTLGSYIGIAKDSSILDVTPLLLVNTRSYRRFEGKWCCLILKR